MEKVIRFLGEMLGFSIVAFMLLVCAAIIYLVFFEERKRPGKSDLEELL